MLKDLYQLGAQYDIIVPAMAMLCLMALAGASLAAAVQMHTPPQQQPRECVWEWPNVPRTSCYQHDSRTPV